MNVTDGPWGLNLAASLAGWVNTAFSGRFMKSSCEPRAPSPFSSSDLVLSRRLHIVFDVRLIVKVGRNNCEDVCCDKQVLCG